MRLSSRGVVRSTPRSLAPCGMRRISSCSRCSVSRRDVVAPESRPHEPHAAVDVEADAAGRDDAVGGAHRRHAADREAVAPVDVGHRHARLDDPRQRRDVGDLLTAPRRCRGSRTARRSHTPARARACRPRARGGRRSRRCVRVRAWWSSPVGLPTGSLSDYALRSARGTSRSGVMSRWPRYDVTGRARRSDVPPCGSVVDRLAACSPPRGDAVAPAMPPITTQSDPWRRDRARIVS